MPGSVHSPDMLGTMLKHNVKAYAAKQWHLGVVKKSVKVHPRGSMNLGAICCKTPK